MNERIRAIRNYYNMNMRDFASKLGLSSGAICMIENGERQVTRQVAQAVIMAFPAIDEDWFRTGEGEMLRPKTRESEIADIVDQMLDAEPGDLRLRITQVRYGLNAEQLELLANIGRDMFGNEKQP